MVRRDLRRGLATLAAALLMACGHAVASEPHARVFDLGGAAVPQQVAVQMRKGGDVFFAAANLGAIGRIDHATGEVSFMALPSGSKPRGLVLAPDDRVYAIDGKSDAIVGHDLKTGENRRYAMPAGQSHLELQMGAFDRRGRLWFTGYSGWYGRLDPASGKIKVYKAPGGRGPFAITTDRAGTVWYTSYAGNYIARVDERTGTSEAFPMPPEADGPKGIVTDAAGRVWCASFRDGALAMFDPARQAWQTFRAPGDNPKLYGIDVAPDGAVWVSDIGENRVLRFDPAAGAFAVAFANLPRAMVRHVAVGQGVIWAAESATDRMIAIRDDGPRPTN